jgi:hypothetical protein
MEISRRKVIAGLAVSGAMIPAAYYAGHKLKAHLEKDDGTPGEAKVELADIPLQRLANQLRGVWQLEFPDPGGGLEGLGLEGVEMFIDVGERGRGMRGFIDTAQNLRGDSPPRYRILGDLVSASITQIRWRLLDRDSPRRSPLYEFTAVLDDIWAKFGVSDRDKLEGSFQRLDAPPPANGTGLQFVARKLPFPEARETVPLNPAFLAWLVAPEHRLAHQLWHVSRDKWHRLSDDRRNALRGLGWQPGPANMERDSRGRHKDSNGSGVDFLFMHRQMLSVARSLDAPPSWAALPLPQPPVECNRRGFARYYDNHDGRSVPPAWLAPEDENYSAGVAAIKSAETFYSNFQVWESHYRDPQYLAQLTLGQFGSELELTMHDWLHMCWASVPRDPANGFPVPMARDSVDFSERWFGADNDFLGDPFSSHVNPLFWGFHGWIDDRIEDWFDAHARAHPGQVVRRELDGLEWFAQGPWVEIDQPWLGPSTHGCGPNPTAGMTANMTEMDAEVMKLALHIANDEQDKVGGALVKVSNRPWYARNLPQMHVGKA